MARPVRVKECVVVATADDEAVPYPVVVPKLRVDVANSFVVHVIVAVVSVVEEAMEVMLGGVVSNSSGGVYVVVKV